jgi:translation initiation factor 2 beta subunit (eIF-2beta)/eIF-5
MLIVMSSMFRGYEVETNLQNYMRLYLQKPVIFSNNNRLQKKKRMWILKFIP